ncbi:MAG: DNA recombination protein RmuC [Verrucomicrobia bacterium]|nr:DNA recombination protein RmuC [Verrucomicrobiota bacterium]
MESLTPYLLVAVLAVVIYVSFFKSTEPAIGDKDSGLLVDELRRQLAAAQATAESERVAKTDALSRVAAAEAARNAAYQQLTEAQQGNERAVNQLREDNRKAQAEATTRHERDLAELKISFSKMSTDVLKGMTPDVTKEVASQVTPLIAQINTALGNYRQTMEQSLSSQGDALAAVRNQMQTISETTAALATSTTDFTSVLKSSQHRGKWGEQTLRNVVEAAGLSPHCDFAEQVSQDDSRPDLIVKLPGNRCIIIDSKVPEFDVALADQAAPNRRELVASHALKLKKTIRDLAAKNYAAAMEKQGVTPFDKVVLFLPAESLLSTALEGDNDLIMDAGRAGILIATPATLIGFLGAINLAWQQHTQAANAGKIAAEATELFDRLVKFAEHFTKVRKGLLAASESLDAAIGSYETRIRPQGERVRELGGAASRDELAEIAPVNANIRRLENSAE